MMHGYGYGYGLGDWMPGAHHIFGTGWTVVAVMGVGLVLLLGVIALLVWSQRGSLGLTGTAVHSRPSSVGPAPSAYYSASPTEAVEQIARRRFASGEIDAAEFKRIMTTLREQ